MRAFLNSWFLNRALCGAALVLASRFVSADEPAPQAAPAPERIALTYKFHAGDFLHYAGNNRVQYMTQLGDQYKSESRTVPLEERTFNSHQENVTEAHLRIVSVDEQGNALVEPVMDRTRMTAQLHGKQPVIFDSASNTAPPPEFRLVREAVGRTVARFQVAPTGKLLKAIIVDATAPQSLRDSAEKLEARFPYLSLMPAAPVAVGDKWKEEYSTVIVNEGLKQPFPIRRIYELTSVTESTATIKFKTLVMSPITDPEVEKQIIQQTPLGTITFDRTRGIVTSYTASIERTTMNAFGPQSLLRVTGQSTEKLVTPDSGVTVGAAQR